MQQVSYRAEPSGGYVWVRRYENGQMVSHGSIPFNTRKQAERVARELNMAIATGIRLAQAAVEGDPAPEGSDLPPECRSVASGMIVRAFEHPVV